MTSLEMWLKRATRWLSTDSAAQVRAEIEEHFAESREAALSAGANEEEAERSALAALGDAAAANRQYRRVLLTAREVRVLRTSAWGVDAICGRGWLRWFVLFWAVVAMSAGIWAWIAGQLFLTEVLLLSALALAMCGLPMYVSIFTPERSRIFRLAKMAYILGIISLALLTFRDPWITPIALFPTLWNEWTRMSIRRKMPVERWPKHLYL
ncbi:MAG: permease prefix domain 1-containing protein [Terracidiphilus sp.]|nr:permease prefix domain 1-containing protein [Terracidiphilus sp.]